MTDYAPNFTPRYLAHYKSAGFNHSIMYRAQRGHPKADVVSDGQLTIQAIMNVLADQLPTDFAYSSATYYEMDSDIGDSGVAVPAATTGLADLGDYSPMVRAASTTFKGSAFGSKASFAVFGLLWDFADPTGVAGNGRVESAEDPNIAGVLTVLDGATNWRVISNAGTPRWYRFATVKVNDYWLKQARKLFT